MKIEEIRLMNETRIRYLKKINKDTYRNQIINKILEDEACFFKMEKEDTLILLEDIGISKDNIESIYNDLISKNRYYELEQKGNINNKDKEILIKYEERNIEEVFEERRERLEKDNTSNIEKNKNKIKTEILETNKKQNIFNKIINKVKDFLKIKKD